VTEPARPPSGGAPTGPGGPKPAEREDNPKRGAADSIKTVGGLIAVGIGAVAVVVVTSVAILSNNQAAGTIAGSAVAVIGSIVGAYLGVKVGTDQTAKALDQLNTAAKTNEGTSRRAERYALHVDKADAPKLTDPG
jgi:hypothetical protein